MASEGARRYEAGTHTEVLDAGNGSCVAHRTRSACACRFHPETGLLCTWYLEAIARILEASYKAPRWLTLALNCAVKRLTGVILSPFFRPRFFGPNSNACHVAQPYVEPNSAPANPTRPLRPVPGRRENMATMFHAIVFFGDLVLASVQAQDPSDVFSIPGQALRRSVRGAPVPDFVTKPSAVRSWPGEPFQCTLSKNASAHLWCETRWIPMQVKLHRTTLFAKGCVIVSIFLVVACTNQFTGSAPADSIPASLIGSWLTQVTNTRSDGVTELSLSPLPSPSRDSTSTNPSE